MASLPQLTAGLGAVALMFIFAQIALMPSVIPFVLFAMQSIWVPQIYRNARRGSNGALGHSFIVGTSIGRLALPLCELPEASDCS
jgi:uncharacterized membrane protein YesL